MPRGKPTLPCTVCQSSHPLSRWVMIEWNGWDPSGDRGKSIRRRRWQRGAWPADSVIGSAYGPVLNCANTTGPFLTSVLNPCDSRTDARGTITIAAFVKLTNTSSSGKAFGTGGGFLDAIDILSIGVDGANGWSACFGLTGPSQVTVKTTEKYDTDWHMVLWVYDRVAPRLYIDGNLVFTGSASTAGIRVNTYRNQQATVGAGSTGSTRFPGLIAGAWLFNRDLTEAEIASFSADPWALYRRPFNKTMRSLGFVAVGVTGSSSVTLASISASQTGTVESVSGITGASSVTLSGLSVSQTGTVAINGDSSVTLSGLSLSQTGTVGIYGSSEKTLENLSVSQAGTVSINGASSVTLSAISVSQSGEVQASGGISNVTLGNVSQTATGTVAISGASSASLANLSPSQSGTVSIFGSSESQLAGVSVSQSGQVSIVGTSIVSLALISVSQSGEVVESGAASNVTLGNVSQSATGTVEISGSSSKTLEGVYVSQDGTVGIIGSSSVTLGSIIALGAGIVEIFGSSSVSLDSLSVSQSGTTGGAIYRECGGLVLISRDERRILIEQDERRTVIA